MRVFGKLIGVQKLKVKENTGWSCGDFTSYWWLKLLVMEINGDWTYSKPSDLLEWISKLCLLFISPPNTKIIGWKKLWDQEMTRVRWSWCPDPENFSRRERCCATLPIYLLASYFRWVIKHFLGIWSLWSQQ